MKLHLAITLCFLISVTLAQSVSIGNIDKPFYRLSFEQLTDFADTSEGKIWDHFVVDDSISFLITSVFIQYTIKKNGPQSFTITGLKYLAASNQDEKIQLPVFELDLEILSSKVSLKFSNEFDQLPNYSIQKIDNIIKRREEFVSNQAYISSDYESIQDSVVTSILLLEEELFIAALNGSKICREYHKTMLDDFFILGIGYPLGLYKSNEEILAFKFENLIPDSRKKVKPIK
jgi:hypothetical protein